MKSTKMKLPHNAFKRLHDPPGCFADYGRRVDRIEFSR